MRCDPAAWSLYFIPEAGGRLPPAAQAAQALAGGARVVQLRLKNASDEEWLRAGRELLGICRSVSRPFIVNDRPDIAELLDADGVHLGREDAPAAAARKRLGSDRVIGVSVTGPEDARRARDDGADYVAVSPVFATQVKTDAVGLGLVAVSRVRAAVDLPLIGIGGITPENAAQVLEAGADGVAVITAISRADDPRAAAARLLEVIEQGLARRRRRQ